RSFADPLQLSGATRFESRIDVPPARFLPDSRWNLDWANRFAFNLADFEKYFPPPGTTPPGAAPPAEGLPLSVEWRGTLAESAPGLLLVRYVGEGEISVGGRSLRLAPAYAGPREVEVPRAANQRDLRATMSFLPPAAAAGRYAAFELLDAETREPVTAATRHPLVSLMVLIGILAVLATILLTYLRALGLAAAPRVTLAVAVATTIIYLGTSVGLAQEARAAGIAACVFAILAAQTWSPHRHVVLTAFLALVALVPTAALVVGFDGSAVVYHPFGEDWRAYLGHAHEILRTGSLEGGESVFYYQPGMRYVLFAGHVLFGAGDVLPEAITMGFFALSVTLFFVRFVPGFATPSTGEVSVWERLHRTRALLPALAVAALLLALVHVGMERFVRYGASEVPTWLLLPAALALLLGSDARVAWATGSLLVGVMVALRLELLPAALLVILLFASFSGRRTERAAWAVGGLLLALGAVVLHNAYYGSEFALVRAEPIVDGRTVVGSDSGVSALGNILPALWDPTARAEVITRVGAIAFLPFDASITGENLAQRLPFHGLLLAWIAAVAYVTLRWRETTWVAKGMAALPLAALAPFLAFDVTTYYPRQIVLGYVAMGLAGLYILGRGRYYPVEPD
ncbi:MAG: hypothetical protein M3433_03595, partial [Actinomycetota bacterium]|nr:hypothetical protein [Actinomycetota bacterium]